jgi:uncharacterized protein YjiK
MSIPYDLDSPRESYKLPKKYEEISGICPIPDTDSLAFVQDERIRVYEFDLSSERINKFNSYQTGDSEDVVILDNTAYILTAGEYPAIHELTDYTSPRAPIERHGLDLDEKYDPEGLCHDANRNRLLIACKCSPDSDDRIRRVFSFDLNSGQLNTYSPVFIIDSHTLGIGSDTFNPSGIAVHPRTNDVYLIGTKGIKMLICCDWDGKVKDARKLDKRMFRQPEGIAFLESGELFICSEGKDEKKARIFRFVPSES